MILNVFKKWVNRFRFYKMVCEIGDHKLAYVDETKHFGEIREAVCVGFYGLETSHMNAVDACKISNVWIG